MRGRGGQEGTDEDGGVVLGNRVDGGGKGSVKQLVVKKILQEEGRDRWRARREKVGNEG